MPASNIEDEVLVVPDKASPRMKLISGGSVMTDIDVDEFDLSGDEMVLCPFDDIFDFDIAWDYGSSNLTMPTNLSQVDTDMSEESLSEFVWAPQTMETTDTKFDDAMWDYINMDPAFPEAAMSTAHDEDIDVDAEWDTHFQQAETNAYPSQMELDIAGPSHEAEDVARQSELIGRTDPVCHDEMPHLVVDQAEHTAYPRPGSPSLVPSAAASLPSVEQAHESVPESPSENNDRGSGTGSGNTTTTSPVTTTATDNTVPFLRILGIKHGRLEQDGGGQDTEIIDLTQDDDNIALTQDDNDDIPLTQDGEIVDLTQDSDDIALNQDSGLIAFAQDVDLMGLTQDTEAGDEPHTPSPMLRRTPGPDEAIVKLRNDIPGQFVETPTTKRLMTIAVTELQDQLLQRSNEVSVLNYPGIED
ncbi:hypothetical protein Micbo1qcDRAFT_210007 [Microdochium bolleyi]|uniref:Uncharacterized protein n=1 Tax=Microdochium bolleyi TaxID=196109 RepID=A0A136IKB1_9PEZI|nr:hypothetical protein Micbo1qcDRAFT_210007 [Microdochium bolleyi]